ncbi:MAG TPA: D-2-hydroxyacid dehydrogenase [Alphaproteobacteria bacterium]|jgi:phosphoglycerate dehydrogenase-like enzyme|nr:D-2-hydroxyacid dehydrogenase [Alphaproteobacteria bacterium]
MIKTVIYQGIVRPDVRALFDAFPSIEPMFVPRDDEAALAKALPGAEIFLVSNRVYTPSVGRIVRDHGTALKWIQFSTAGYDNALNAGLPKGVVVTNCGGVRAHSVAEQAFTLLLALARQCRAVEAANNRHRWIRDEITPSLHNIAGRRMVIVGMGPVGQALTRRARAFDMTVSGVSRTPEPPPGVDRVYPRERFLDACREAEVLVLATALDDDTQRIINAESLAALPKGAYLINIGRGLMVDEAALVDALRSGHLGGAGLDVTEIEPTPSDSPLWDIPNVVLSPHIAGAGDPADVGVGKVVAENLRTYLAGKPFPRALRT